MYILGSVQIFRLNLDWGIPDFAFMMSDTVIIQVTGMMLSMSINILFGTFTVMVWYQYLFSVHQFVVLCTLHSTSIQLVFVHRGLKGYL